MCATIITCHKMLRTSQLYLSPLRLQNTSNNIVSKIARKPQELTWIVFGVINEDQFTSLVLKILKIIPAFGKKDNGESNLVPSNKQAHINGRLSFKVSIQRQYQSDAVYAFEKETSAAQHRLTIIISRFATNPFI
ncbi:Tetratricopeptide repeat protein [Dirofilaria immitis]